MREVDLADALPSRRLCPIGSRVFVVIVLLVTCLAAPSPAEAGIGRGRPGALAGALMAAALTGPSGIPLGTFIGRQLSIIMTEATMRAIGIDPIVTCGTSAGRRCKLTYDTSE